MISVLHPAPVLVLDGDLDLNGPGVDPFGTAFTIKTDVPESAQGADWGNADAITNEIASQLTDGALVTVNGWTNRTIIIPLRVHADTSAGLAAGEAALRFRTGDRATTLAWTPPVLPDDTAFTSIFDVWYSTLAITADTVAEQRYTRYFTLTLVARPDARSVDLIEIPAIEKPVTVVDELVDDCTSTTGWTGSPNTPTTSSGSVLETITTTVSARSRSGAMLGSPKYELALTRTFTSAVDMSDSPYLMVQFALPGVNWTPGVKLNGVKAELVAYAGQRRWYQAPASLTSVEVIGDFFTKRAMTVALAVKEIRRTNLAGPIATDKEIVRTFWVSGSAPTLGSIRIEHATDPLGDVILYTEPASPSGFVPSMQRYQTDGPTPSGDTDAVTGIKQLISIPITDDPATFTIPANQLLEATYGVLCRLKSPTPDDYRLTFEATIAGRPTVFLDTITTITDGDYHFVWVGSLTLPPYALPPESDVNVVCTFEALSTSWTLEDPTTGDVYLDDLWLFNLDDGALSVVHAGDAQRLRFDSPDDDSNVPAIYAGVEADWSDAVGLDLGSAVPVFGRGHQMLPGRMVAFTVSTGAGHPLVTPSFYPRDHTNVAR